MDEFRGVVCVVFETDKSDWPEAEGVAGNTQKTCLYSFEMFFNRMISRAHVMTI